MEIVEFPFYYFIWNYSMDPFETIVCQITTYYMIHTITIKLDSIAEILKNNKSAREQVRREKRHSIPNNEDDATEEKIEMANDRFLSYISKHPNRNSNPTPKPTPTPTPTPKLNMDMEPMTSRRNKKYITKIYSSAIL